MFTRLPGFRPMGLSLICLVVAKQAKDSLNGEAVPQNCFAFDSLPPYPRIFFQRRVLQVAQMRGQLTFKAEVVFWRGNFSLVNPPFAEVFFFLSLCLAFMINSAFVFRWSCMGHKHCFESLERKKGLS